MKKLFYLLLMVLLFAACASRPQEIPVSVNVVQPDFEIVSIVILQADLVNTQFETVLKIVNPNSFNLRLSSIKYELYGNGMFWAQGTADNDFIIPAESSVETKFRFSMNFINMNRRLLDDIIAMRQVRYNFKGEAFVQATVPRTPGFTMKYDISGMSDVKPRAD